MQPSEKQLNAIHYHLWKRPDSIPEAHWITFDQWNLLKPHLDKMTASDVIGAFKRGAHTTAINQLLHLIDKV